MSSSAKKNFSMSLLLGVFLSLGFGVLSDSSWKPGKATFYGDPEGNGSNGGACGYGTLVDVLPYKTHVTAAGGSLYQNGMACGSCYMVRCTDKTICSGIPVKVIVTDQCPECNDSHFDLSGSAFSQLAIRGRADQLRTKGVLPIEFQRKSCGYPGMKIGFRVNEGSSPYWLSLLVVYESGDGDIGEMLIKQATSNEWMPMAHSFGANWFITGKGPLKGPFSVRIRTLATKKSKLTRDVIPSNFVPGVTYSARLR